jgi:hypothetical protein
VAKVLGKALSWLIFSPSSKCLSQALRDPVPTAACNNIAQLPAWENPVMKIALVISGSKGELCLDELGRILVVHKMALLMESSHQRRPKGS